jgi:pilus assembly protein CpaD
MTRIMSNLTRLLAATSMTACAALFSGCDHPKLSNMAAVDMNNPERSHRVHFATQREVLEVELPSSADGLSLNQQTDVVRFLDRYRRDARGKLAISVPAGARANAGAARAIQSIQAAVTDAGVDYRVVTTARHGRGGGQHVSLAYDRVTSEPPACDRWPENIGTNEERLPTANFGCSTQRNIALMVNNPRDLVRPQPEDVRSSERRNVSWAKYIKSGGAEALKSNELPTGVINTAVPPR